MQMIHVEMPGTTFYNPDQRGDYDSENKATLTLRELERWLALAVGTYHGSVHNGLLQPPAARWAEAVRSEEHTSELQSRGHLVCRLLPEKKNTQSSQHKRAHNKQPRHATT